MAKLVANIGLDPEDLNFEQFSGGVFSNSDATQATQFQVAAVAGGFPITVTVTGEGFQYGVVPGRGEVPFTGVVDSISVSAAGVGDVFSLTDITREPGDPGKAYELTIAKLLDVADSANLNDNLALIRNILKGADELTGSGAGDVLSSFAGADTIVGGGGGDTMNGGAGKDTVSYATSKAVTIDLTNPANGAGDADGDVLIDVEFIIGSAKSDTFIGGNGKDRFDSGAGKDTIDGGGGDDIFEFSSDLVKKNADRIENFDSGNDKLFLSKTIFLNVNEDSVGIGAKSFVIGSKATTGDHRIIYNDNSGELFYDGDGRGGDGKKLIATLDPSVDLARSDFELF